LRPTYGIYLPVALDTKGPEIRTGYMENGCVPVKKGQVMRITGKKMVGTATKFYCTYEGLYDDVKVGDTILIDDGNLMMKVNAKGRKRAQETRRRGSERPLHQRPKRHERADVETVDALYL
jgi:pyruvate kinase